MKISYHCLKINYLIFRTAIAREQKQFIKIAFAVHLSAVISAERYRSESGALKRAVSSTSVLPCTDVDSKFCLCKTCKLAPPQSMAELIVVYFYILRNIKKGLGFLRAEPLSSNFEDRRGYRGGKKVLSDKSVFPPLKTAPIDDEAKKHNENLPGMGGVFNVVNLHVYHYAGNNPVKYTDPDGRQTAAIGLAKILSKIWAVAFAEPTPAGEVIAAAATVCILYLYFVDNAESSPTILETPDSVNNINPKTEFPGYDSNKTIDGFPETNKNNVHNTFPDTDRSTNIFEEYIPAPDSIPGIPDAKIAKRKTPVQKGGGVRKRWKDNKGNIYEWDSLHGELEKYNKRGIHQGVVDPNTGEQIEPPKNDRKVEP